MSNHAEHKQAPSLARRHLLRIAAATAGRVGALAALEQFTDRWQFVGGKSVRPRSMFPSRHEHSDLKGRSPR